MTQIIFHSSGAGRQTLMLHAFPLNSRMWDKQIEALSTMGSTWAPDLPGFGDSAHASTYDSLDELAAQLVELLHNQGVSQATVVGCSMGGYLAFALLRVAPKFCTKLVLINSKASADSEQARLNRLALAQRVEHEGCAFLVDEWHLGALSPTTLHERPAVVEQVRALVRQATPKGVSCAQRAMAARPDSTAMLESIDVPALIVHGLDDRYVSEAEARDMAACIRGSSFVAVEQAGHLPNLEQPALVTGILQNFIA